MTSHAAARPRLAYRDMRSRAEELADEHIKERVLAGIEFLNKEYGPDWVDHVDPNVLIMAEGNACVLGQVYKNEAKDEEFDSGYDYALTMFSSSTCDWEIDHAFCTGDETFNDLDEAWKAVLAYEE